MRLGPAAARALTKLLATKEEANQSDVDLDRRTKKATVEAISKRIGDLKKKRAAAVAHNAQKNTENLFRDMELM